MNFVAFWCCFVAVVMAEISQVQSIMAYNVLTQGQELRFGSQLISPTGIFVLGFYNPNSLNNATYLGISYNFNHQKPIWIANPNSPIFANDSASMGLVVDANGSLIIQNGSYFFSLFDVGESITSSSAVLQDDGNFVLRELNRDGSVKEILWQSFDHPTDTLLPGMKIGINHKTNSTWSLTSWRNEESPKPGAFRLGMNPNNTFELVMFIRDALFWRSGNWEDGSFEFLENNKGINFNRVSNENETYFIYFSFNNNYRTESTSVIQTQFRLKEDGNLRMNMNNDDYEHSICPLLEKDNEGCVWKKQHKMPQCRNWLYPYGVAFKTMFVHTLEDAINASSSSSSSSSYKDTNLTRFECETICIYDCDCIGFGVSKLEDGNGGCEIWKSGAKIVLMDEGQRQGWFLDGEESDPPAPSPHPYPYNYGNGKMEVWVPVTIGLALSTIFLLLCFIIYANWRTQIIEVLGKFKKCFLRRMWFITEDCKILGMVIRQITDWKKNPELQFFDFETIVSATNNFGDECKLGKGGFGPVYKGVMTDGQEVAIKRLSKNSGQGLVEFKNETILIAKLQHTNLVRLIGCCLHKEEKLLVYEYMPNKSLDFFLFDLEKKLILDWKKRLHVIQGIIQGLIYLHHYSRIRIIHRDLKVSNILLDDEMNAKISDFGMAKVFKPPEHETNTGRVVGTYGYISPEYAMEGIFSIKSDVYSFGILLLEIVTSRKNYNNYDTERPLNLIGYAWELWVNGRGEELIDSGLFTSDDQKPKALRCIHVSLLCVQQIPADRPTMLDIYFMISNDSAQLPSPKQPAFFVAQNPNSSEPEIEEVNNELIRPPVEPTPEIYSSNTMTVSVMVAR
ncbi:hypothetical protein IC582_002568 [Cucumis melo]|uniref:Receptor-like serine/threonine-protein kinase n=1 Tax=Cucumis melo TaxID=3656 RepID=A0A1S4E3P4_CUCME|nr:G-type lectin S-receptor-like serine/threonine-protein kinase At1g67520 isoform X2 [Cucumis melo]